MSYDTEFERLQKIITADNSTEEQRDIARNAKEKLIDNAIENAFKRIEKRSAKYNVLIKNLESIVNDIKENKLTTALADIEGVMQEVVKESKKDNGDDEAG